MLEAGIRGKQNVTVTPENTAKTMGSGTLNVFATPALVALAEKTCWMSVADALDEGCGSVGTKLELEHTAPTPVGMTVTCESELTAVEGRKLVFKVSLYDEKRPCGRRRPRALCGQRRKVCRQGREQERAKTPFSRQARWAAGRQPAALLGPGLSFLQKPCRCSLARNSSKYIAL